MEKEIKDILNQIKKIILQYKKVDKIILFGSRATKKYKRTSDIDIAIVDKNIDVIEINNIKNIIEEEIKTVLKFDIINFNEINKEELKQQILKKGLIIYDKNTDKAFI